MSQILNNLVLYQIPVSVSTFEHLDHLLTPHILQYYSDEFLFFQTSQQIIIIALYIQYALRYYDPSHCTLSLLAYPNQHPRLVCICLKILFIVCLHVYLLLLNPFNLYLSENVFILTSFFPLIFPLIAELSW